MVLYASHKVLYGVVWCGVVWCGVVWCGVVWCGVVWCGVVWCGVVLVLWCGVGNVVGGRRSTGNCKLGFGLSKKPTNLSQSGEVPKGGNNFWKEVFECVFVFVYPTRV